MDFDNFFHVTGSSSDKAARRSGSGSPDFGPVGSGAPTPAALPRTGTASTDANAADGSGWTNPAPRGNTFDVALPFPDGFRAQLGLGPLMIPVSNPSHSTSEHSDEGLQCDAWMYWILVLA
jgi:hypothetical protein